MGKGQETRTQILRAALKQACHVGLEGLSIGGLASQVGMSKSGLFTHFGSKESLQKEVLLYAGDRFADAIIRPAVLLPRGEPRVKALFENWLEWTVPFGCVFVSTAYEFDDRPGMVRDELLRLIKDWRDTMARAAEIAIEVGHFRADIDPQQFAFEMHSLTLGYHIDERLFRVEGARQRALKAFESLRAASR